MDRLYRPKRVIEVLNKYGFRFTKSLGQNFLIDGNIVEKIVDAAEVTKDDYCLEIGCGIGTLTEELALRAKKVVAIEIDKRLENILKETLPYDNVSIVFKDVLKTNLKEIVDEHFAGKKIKVVANLPYYVTTPIIEKLIHADVDIESITVMVQKEVAKRFTARTDTKDYGSLSVFIDFFADPEYKFTVPKTVFMPKPNVESAVVSLKLKKELPDIDREKFFKIVRAAFSKRRKTLLNALSTYGFDKTKEEIENILLNSNIDPKRRAESLSLDEFIVLSINF